LTCRYATKVTIYNCRIIAGIVSFGIAEFQAGDNANQGFPARQAQIAQQLQTDSAKLYELGGQAIGYRIKCGFAGTSQTPCSAQSPDTNVILAENDTVAADGSNLADQQAKNLVAALVLDMQRTLNAEGFADAQLNWLKATSVYKELVARCSEIIQRK